MKFFLVRLILLNISIFPIFVISGYQTNAPYISVLFDSDSELLLKEAIVVVSNSYKDKAILITSVEFKYQLPETFNFYELLYGQLCKQSNIFINERIQVGTVVGTCFLLSGQSITWKRFLRVSDQGYTVFVKWCEIPKNIISNVIWFHSGYTNYHDEKFIPLTKNLENYYRIASNSSSILPYVYFTNDFEILSKTNHADCYIYDKSYEKLQKCNSEKQPSKEIITKFSNQKGSLLFRNNNIIFSNIKYHYWNKYSTLSFEVQPIVLDYIYLHSKNKPNGSIPCIMPKNDFNDIIKVNEPDNTSMYYRFGVTYIPVNIFYKILLRVKKRNYKISINNNINDMSIGYNVMIIEK